MADWEDRLQLGDELEWQPLRLAPPDPWVGHLPFAFWLVRSLRPSVLVELGTHSGNSYFGMCQAIDATGQRCQAFAVDTWLGDPHAGLYGEDVFADVAAFNRAHFRPFSTLLRATFDDARGYFADGSIDLLHIDGMHTYEAVRHDFEAWRPALSPRAVVLFHDINVRERGFGVWRLWQELAAQYPAFAFGHSNGLGVLGVGAEPAPPLAALFALPPDHADALRRRLAARGEAFQRQIEVLDLQARLHAAEAARREASETLRATTETARGEQHWRDALLARQAEALAAKSALVAGLEETAAARAAVIAVRDTLLAAGEDRLAEREAQLRALRRERDGQTAEMERLREAAAEAEARAERSQAEQAAAVAAREAVVRSEFTRSASWRVTAPLRRAMRLAGRRPPAAASLPAPPPPAPTPAEPAAAAAAPTETGHKAALRRMLMARLQAFLAGPEMLRLPRAERPEVSILLVLYNQAELTFACLSSIAETLADGDVAAEVVIADNDSSDLTGALLDRIEGATIHRHAYNMHFLRAVNQASRSVRGRTMLLLNNDAQLLPGAVASALRTLHSAPGIGAVGGRIILTDGTLQEAGSIVWRDGTAVGYGRGDDPNSPDYMFQRDVDYCSGAFLLTPTQLFHDMGGFDDGFAPAYYEETDYCVRLWQAGRRVVYDPDAAIVHFEFGSAAADADALALQAAHHKRFAERHKHWLARQFPPAPENIFPARTRPEAKRVLMIEDRVPYPELGSGYPRANRIVHALLQAGAQVAFFPTYRHPETWHRVRRALDKRVELLIAAEASQIGNFLQHRRRHFDAILVCRPLNMQAFEAAVGPDRALLGDTTVLYDAEAVFATRDLQRRRAQGTPATEDERRRLIAEEATLTRRAGAVISVSAAEQKLLEQYGVRRVHLLGHALDTAPIGTGFEERNQMAFLGAIHDDNAPNADAVRWFVEGVLPSLRAALGETFRLTVVGMNEAASIAKMDGAEVTLAGPVDDLAQGLARARVLVVPMRLGAGIPHKAHQAAMLGIPMVATSLVAGQLGWQDGQELLVADSGPDFAAACLRLYRDPALWEAVRGRALDRVRQECDADAFAAQVQRILDEVPRTHRMPEPDADQPDSGWPPEPPPAPAPPAVCVARPAARDYSLAVPLGYRPRPADPPPHIAVLCHLFHADAAPEMLHYLRHLPQHTDLFVSTDTPAKHAALAAAFAGWDKGAVDIRVLPNRGRDIAPKLVGLADAHAGHDLVLHLHAKVSSHAHFLAPWRSFLLESLLGSPEVVASVLEAFAQLPELGMVAAQHYEAVRRWLEWQGIFPAAAALAERMGITLDPHRAIDFPSGSMFWARPAALRPLLDLQLSVEDFPPEAGQVDGTLAHAIERLFFYVCERSGHGWLKIAQPALYADTRTIVEVSSPRALRRFVARHGVTLTGSAELPRASEPAPMMTEIPPGLAARLAARVLQ